MSVETILIKRGHYERSTGTWYCYRHGRRGCLRRVCQDSPDAPLYKQRAKPTPPVRPCIPNRDLRMEVEHYMRVTGTSKTAIAEACGWLRTLPSGQVTGDERPLSRALGMVACTDRTRKGVKSDVISVSSALKIAAAIGLLPREIGL